MLNMVVVDGLVGISTTLQRAFRNVAPVRFVEPVKPFKLQDHCHGSLALPTRGIQQILNTTLHDIFIAGLGQMCGNNLGTPRGSRK